MAGAAEGNLNATQPIMKDSKMNMSMNGGSHNVSRISVNNSVNLLEKNSGRDRFKEHKKVFFKELMQEQIGKDSPGCVYSQNNPEVSSRNHQKSYSFSKVSNTTVLNFGITNVMRVVPEAVVCEQERRDVPCSQHVQLGCEAEAAEVASRRRLGQGAKEFGLYDSECEIQVAGWTEILMRSSIILFLPRTILN